MNDDRYYFDRNGQLMYESPFTFDPNTARREAIVENACTDRSVDVRNPDYYTLGGEGVECIDIIKEVLGIEEAIAFCKGNIIKYRVRLGQKYKYGTKGFDDDVQKIKKYIEMKKKLEKEWTDSFSNL